MHKNRKWVLNYLHHAIFFYPCLISCVLVCSWFAIIQSKALDYFRRKQNTVIEPIHFLNRYYLEFKQIWDVLDIPATSHWNYVFRLIFVPRSSHALHINNKKIIVSIIAWDTWKVIFFSFPWPRMHVQQIDERKFCSHFLFSELNFESETYKFNHQTANTGKATEKEHIRKYIEHQWGKVNTYKRYKQLAWWDS